MGMFTQAGARRATLLAVAAGTVALATFSAQADTFYNTLDTTVDSNLEVLNLATGGSDGTVTIALQIDGHPASDHPGCNLNGNPHFVEIGVNVADTNIATASFGGDPTAVFDSCSDTATVTVHPVAVGSTNVTFTQVDQDLAADPHMNFSYAQAAFTVNVSDGSITPVETGCDADPAAPAWAAAILQANGVKPGTPASKNLISQVAHNMGNGATFNGIVKNDHPDYENAVYTYLQGISSKPLTTGLDGIHRPGWECTTV